MTELVKGVNDIASCKEMMELWDNSNILDPSKICRNSNAYICTWKCIEHKIIYNKTPNGVMQALLKGNNACPLNGPKMVISNINSIFAKVPEILKFWCNDNDRTAYEVSYGSHYKIHLHCPDCEIDWYWSARQVTNAKLKYNCFCPGCRGTMLVKGKNDLLSQHPELSREFRSDLNNITPDNIFHRSGKKYKWECSNCHHVYMASPHARTIGRGCPKCALISNNSSGESELINFIKNEIGNNYDNFIECVEVKGILTGTKSIDIALYKEKIAFEYNGTYWHSDAIRKPSFHYERFDMCNKNGFHCYYIYDDDWINYKYFVYDAIKRALKTTELKSVNSNKCIMSINNIIPNWIPDSMITVSNGLTLSYNGMIIGYVSFDSNCIHEYIERPGYHIENGLIAASEKLMHDFQIPPKLNIRRGELTDSFIIPYENSGILQLKSVSQPSFMYCNDRKRSRIQSGRNIKIYDAGYNNYDIILK